ncbi:GNAT family N-acetyltransferase [Macrococcoides canis]|uniref:GNAT family N-acetyltransferase n=1 Tax=Macrococcoides canis TaxID=1855823 RepID=A0A4R6C7E2_9STAP|nr:GNAT family N-acetyltransferase [Macrococcus canis]TDM18217.1 GNAT family N-acetyltransferase [Macrococcus canis]
MDNIVIQKLSQEHAEEIANEWKYEDIYKFYDATEDKEDYDELISPDKREENYFEVLVSNELIGYFVIDASKTGSIDYGLGMKPELTGRGLGKSFINITLRYIVGNYDVDTITLSVALFNERAIKCYENVGFIRANEFDMKTNGSTFRFVRMSKRVKDIQLSEK